MSLADSPRAQPTVAGGWRVLPVVGIAAAILGGLEWAYHRLGPAVPPGEPGSGGPVLPAYLALYVTAVGIPALVGAALTARSWRWFSVGVTWLFGLLPTLLVAVAHVVRERHLAWFEAATLQEHYTRVVSVGGALALLGTVLGTWACLRLLRGPLGTSRLLGRFAAAVGIVATLGGPVLLARTLRLPAAAAPANVSDGPNVLLLTIDTLRRDALGAYGGGSTPALDALIAQGVRCDGVSPSSWTRPAMGSLFSAAAPTGVGASAERGLNPATDWWPERLRAAGWRTRAIVTNPHLRRSYGFARGFEGFDHSDQLEPLEPIAQSFWARWLTRQITERLEYDRADQVVARATRWLGRERQGPWLLWVHLLDPHLPYVLRGPGGEASDPQPGAWLQPLAPAMERGAFRALMPVREGTVATDGASRAAVRELYRREVLFTDRYVRLLLERARASAGARGLLWVLTSDHGEELWDEGGFEHGHALNDAVIDVPLALGGAGLPAGGRIGGMKLQDIGPTVLTLVGLDAMEPTRGTLAGDAALPAELNEMAFGVDRSAQLRAAAAVAARDPEPALPDSVGAPAALPGACAPAPLLAEGILYGPQQTRLVFDDGQSVTRADSSGWLDVIETCQPDLPAQRTTLPALRRPAVAPPLTLPPPGRLELRAGLLEAVDRWRLLARDLAAPVTVDAATLERLRALGYIR